VLSPNLPRFGRLLQKHEESAKEEEIVSELATGALEDLLSKVEAILVIHLERWQLLRLSNTWTIS
jgi:hypothetical protein